MLPPLLVLVSRGLCSGRPVKLLRPLAASRAALEALGTGTRRGRLELGGSGDLVSLLRNGPYRAYYGLLWWLIGDTGLTKSTDHPRTTACFSPRSPTYTKLSGSVYKNKDDVGLGFLGRWAS